MDKRPIMIVRTGHLDAQRIKEYLLCWEYKVLEVREERLRLGSWASCDPALVILFDFGEAGREGLNAAKQIRAKDRSMPLILITHRSSEVLAIAALKLGVNDYFKWPVNDEELRDGIKRLLTGSQRRSGQSEQPHQQACPDHVLIGDSPSMQNIRAFLPRVGHTDSTVLITGETGTGKECVARQVHSHSLRHNKPLVCINCAAVPDSLLESELFGFEQGAFTGANQRSAENSNLPMAAASFSTRLVI